MIDALINALILVVVFSPWVLGEFLLPSLILALGSAAFLLLMAHIIADEKRKGGRSSVAEQQPYKLPVEGSIPSGPTMTGGDEVFGYLHERLYMREQKGRATYNKRLQDSEGNWIDEMLDELLDSCAYLVRHRMDIERLSKLRDSDLEYMEATIGHCCQDDPQP